jgi:hypothetical protein
VFSLREPLFASFENTIARDQQKWWRVVRFRSALKSPESTWCYRDAETLGGLRRPAPGLTVSPAPYTSL